METILIVEDETDIRESLAELLGLRGYDVVTVVDGREALERLGAGLTPCLIILDLMLPVMSGWEFRRQQLAHERWAEIPTILLSGINNLPDESQRLRAVGFLLKTNRPSVPLQHGRPVLLASLAGTLHNSSGQAVTMPVLACALIGTD